MTFGLPQRYIDEMIAHAREDVPNECCGVLLGQDGEVAKLRRCVNAEHSPFRYSVDPRELLEIDREAREHSWEVISIYHSHTHTEAYPSMTDVRLAAYPEAIYILVSLQNQDQPVVRGYYIRDGVVTEEALQALNERASDAG
jgi:proteasome lid subunit RPN8/RPN11